MDTAFVKCDVQDHVALVTMDRPPVNAVNAQNAIEFMSVGDGYRFEQNMTGELSKSDDSRSDAGLRGEASTRVQGPLT